MVVIDEKQEAIARIRMSIDNDAKAQRAQLESDNEMRPSGDVGCANNEALELASGTRTDNHWQLGSAEGKRMNLRVLAAEREKTHPEYHSLDERVRDFIAQNLPSDAMQYEDEIYVSSIYVTIIHNPWLNSFLNQYI
jgi:hypothetical protein